jgi:flavoprotein
MHTDNRRRWAWALTGSGHFLDETIAALSRLQDLDVFMSPAAVEVLKMYKKKLHLADDCRVFSDKTASAAPVGAFYYGIYHTVIVAPATSNAVAKFVCGISDDLVSNVFAHAGKTRVPIFVFACDTAPELLTMAPKGVVKVFPRRIDLNNRDLLADFDGVKVVDSTDELVKAIELRQIELNL